ncbi:hypothetical protein ACFWBG_34535 [Nocardia salmonicida]|uniref:hypothetical protein n=1 Tax=Nocardia salmonicida TaxID=53431 RepID=UPI0036715875
MTAEQWAQRDTGRKKAGAASAVDSTASDLGVALGVALLGSMGAAVYRAGMSGEAGAAAETLPGALSSAESLPAEVAESVVAAGREAFTNGLNAAAWTAAVLAVALLRRIPAGATTVPETEEGVDVSVGDGVAERGTVPA